MKAWVKIQNDWYELLGIGQTIIAVLVGTKAMTLPKQIVDGYRLS